MNRMDSIEVIGAGIIASEGIMHNARLSILPRPGSAKGASRPTSLDATMLHIALVDRISASKRSDEPLIVGINGVDGSGKSTIAGALAQHLRRSHYDVCVISVDDFHRPRSERYRRGELSPLAYYHDSIHYEILARHALQPVFEARAYPLRCQTKLLDLASDLPDVRFEPVTKETIVLRNMSTCMRPR